MLESILEKFRRLIPGPVFRAAQKPYHWLMAWSGAVCYGFPSRQIKVIGVTGTKGKSSTTEIINAILEEAGYRTALSNTIRFKIADHSTPNLFKMSMPGRFTMQRLLREAVTAGCQYFVAEITSQGSLLFRHRFIELDTLVFTNLSPEHIEAHGSYENYVQAKVNIARNMSRSSKPVKTIIVNADDPEASKFLACTAHKHITYSARDASPYEIKDVGLTLTLDGQKVQSPLSGLFNLYNIVAAVTAARNEGVTIEQIKSAIERFGDIPGRVEKIEAGQDFTVVVDYAHTPDSLEKLYRVFRPDPGAPSRTTKLIAILGGTGGGRDTWKRREMGRLADQYADIICLTDEDPYDENPDKIVADVATGITVHKPQIVMDRRLAMREMFKLAKAGDIVLITGKGTDPYIMGPHGEKTPWSDARIAREELESILKDRA